MREWCCVVGDLMVSMDRLMNVQITRQSTGQSVVVSHSELKWLVRAHDVMSDPVAPPTPAPPAEKAESQP